MGAYGKVQLRLHLGKCALRVLYIGVTSDLVKRVWQHREGAADGFTKQHRIKQLVWYEIHSEILQAITREKQIKKWNRDWKVNLIQTSNPDLA
jgi:putative endonuclease